MGKPTWDSVSVLKHIIIEQDENKGQGHGVKWKEKQRDVHNVNTLYSYIKVSKYLKRKTIWDWSDFIEFVKIWNKKMTYEMSLILS